MRIKKINYEIIGDSHNFNKFLKEFNTKKVYNLRKITRRTNFQQTIGKIFTRFGY